MSVTIAIVNQKGGVGKSTTAGAIGAGLILKGYSVLLVDLDAQGNLTFAAGAGSGGITSVDMLSGSASAESAIQHTANGDIIPASPANEHIRLCSEEQGRRRLQSIDRRTVKNDERRINHAKERF